MSVTRFKKIIPAGCYNFMKEQYIKLHQSNFMERLRMLRNSVNDFMRYSEFSSTYKPSKSKVSYESYVIFLYHKIEKGLSLKNVKVGFGQKNIEKLLNILDDFLIKYGWNDICQAATNSLEAYYQFNKKNGYDDLNLINKINKFKDSDLKYAVCNGGIEEVFKKDIDKRKIDFREFAYSRYSIRNFIPEEVNMGIITEAVSIAQKTPSVCNRQTSRVHIYNDTAAKSAILKHQNGNIGFGENASKILIVTNSLECFIGSHEKNQCYIDGGMYAMSLIYALHSLGIGTCALNLALGSVESKKLRVIAQIPDSEVMIMMIAVGNIPDKFNVATSYRRDAESVISIH